jgi:ABC-type sugar transport system substrate-binding protein
LKTAGALALAAGTGAGILMPRPVRASKKKLKILCWSHTDSDANWWFWKYCKEWGERNDIQVDMRQATE